MGYPGLHERADRQYLKIECLDVVEGAADQLATEALPFNAAPTSVWMNAIFPWVSV